MTASSEAGKICAVCGYPPEEITNTFTGEHEGWVHYQRAMTDHPVVPVDPGEVSVNHVCDFCQGGPVTEAVLCRTFLVVPGFESEGMWAMCPMCAVFVHRRRWQELAVRVQSGETTANRAPVSGLVMMYKKVEANMYGIIPIGEWLARNHFIPEQGCAG